MHTKEAARKLIDEFMPLFDEKYDCYGPGTYLEEGLTGVLSRMTDKFHRAKNLYQNDSAVNTKVESFRDTLRDLIGYAIIANLVFEGQWGIENKTETGETPVDLTKSLLLKRTPESKAFGVMTPKKAGDVGYDLYTTETIVLPAGADRPTQVPTGTQCKVPKGHFAMIFNRSSTAMKMGIDVVTGVIDEGYTGPLYACCWNRTGENIIITPGTRLAQLIVFPSCVPETHEVDTLPETERGGTGFGSTG